MKTFTPRELWLPTSVLGDKTKFTIFDVMKDYLFIIYFRRYVLNNNLPSSNTYDKSIILTTTVNSIFLKERRS